MAAGGDAGERAWDDPAVRGPQAMSDPDDRLFDFTIDDPPYAKPRPGNPVREVAPMKDVFDAESEVTVNYLGEVGALLKDCDRIRRHAMKLNTRTQKYEIYNPSLFEKAVARRQSILSAAVKLHADLWSQHAQAEFYRLMVATIAQESPECAHRLIAALKKINSPVLEVIEAGPIMLKEQA
jgi:hypothetical protein